MKKNLPFILASIITTFGASVLIAHAQGYAPLADIGIDTKSVTDSSKLLPTYLSGALKLIIALGGALSILMAIIAGTKYVAAGISPDAKKNAKSDITNALIGLALILSSYLILNTINPNLVALNFSLPNVILPPTATTTNPYADVMGASSCPAGIPCKACSGCSSIPASLPNKGCGIAQCFLNTSLLAKIQKIPQNIGEWRITESWPPTVSHISLCHQDGTCADLNNSSASGSTNTTPVIIKFYYDTFKAAGLDVLYESNNCAPYINAGVDNCATYSTMTSGSLFHVK